MIKVIFKKKCGKKRTKNNNNNNENGNGTYVLSVCMWRVTNDNDTHIYILYIYKGSTLFVFTSPPRLERWKRTRRTFPST